MNAGYDLELIKRRLVRLESELAATREHVAQLEQHLAAAESEGRQAESPPAPVAGQAPAFVESGPIVVPPPLPERAGSVIHSPPAASARQQAEAPPEKTSTIPREAANGMKTPAGPSPIRVWLERLQLWPPQGDVDVEIRLGAWWATRLGILFAVIGVVFFGVYLSVGTPPWVKLGELVAVSVGVAGLGLWLERRIPRFGQVLYAGGQALVFFAAFAAYAVPAVKVLDSRLAAAFWQLAAAAAIGASAWRRREPAEATLAVALGYVAAWFSFAGGLQAFALGASLALGLTAVVWKRLLGWAAPSVAALAGFWFVYGTLVRRLGEVATLAVVPEWIIWFVPAGFAVFFWRDDPPGRTTDGAHETWFQNSNSTAALGLGWLTAWVLFRSELDVFYTLAALVLGLASWRRLAVVRGDTVGAVLLAKATGALTLAVITWCNGRSTEVALLVQAAVMLAANRRLRSPVMAVGAALVTVVSLGYYFDAVWGATYAVWSLVSGMHVVYVTAAVVWGLEAGRDFGVPFDETVRRSLVRGTAAVAWLLVLSTALSVTPQEWRPSWLVFGGGLLAGIAARWGSAALWGAAAGALVAAHVALWLSLGARVTAEMTWVNALAVLLPSALAATWLGRRADSAAWWRPFAWSAGWSVVLSLLLTIGELHGGVLCLVLALGLAGAAAVAAPRRPARSWMWLAAVTVLAGWLIFLLHPVDGRDETAMIAAVVVWGGTAAVVAWARGREQLARESRAGWPQRFGVWVGWALALQAAFAVPPSEVLGEALGGFALLASALLTWAWIGAWRWAAWSLWGLAGVLILIGVVPAGDGPWMTLLVVTAWTPSLVWEGSTRWAQRFALQGGNVRPLVRVQSWLAGGVTAVAIVSMADGTDRVAWFTGAAAVMIFLARLRWTSLAAVARAFVVLTLATATIAVAAGTARTWGTGAVIVFTAALSGALLPILLPGRSGWRRRLARWGTPGWGLGVAFALAAAQHGALAPFVTVGWGGAALVWFGIGLVARAKPHRLLGLVGVVACVPRVFIVDLDSTLYRIVAFVVLGVILLWVGFSYHRFRRWIAEEPVDTDGKH